MDFGESIGISFKVNSNNLYGIPERADTVKLRPVERRELYRLYNLDIFQHYPYSS